MNQLMLCTLIAFLSIPALSMTDTERLFPQLAPGECASMPETKVYLSYLKSNHEGSFFKSVLTAIGEDKIKNLSNTADINYYFCQVRCKSSSPITDDANETEHITWVQHSDAPANFDNQNGFLCKHVSVELVPLVGSLSTLAPVVSRFSGFESSAPELHSLFIKNNFKIKESAKNAILLRFQSNILNIGRAFIQSNSDVLKAAGEEMFNYSQMNETGKKLLKQRITRLSNSNWNFPVDYTSKDYFIDQMLSQNGRFLEYLDLD